MEIIIPETHKREIHPVLVIKEAWAVCRKHLGKMCAIYLIFYLPVAALYLTPMAKKLQNQNLSLSAFLYIVLPVMILSAWGHISLLLGAQKAVDQQGYTIGQSIIRARVFFLKYLGIALITTLFSMSLMLLGLMSVTGVFSLLLKVNKILSISIALVVAIAFIGTIVYFILRWSLAAVACVLENMQPIAALKSSFSLVEGYLYPVAMVYCLFATIYTICLLFFMAAGAFVSADTYARNSNLAGIIFNIFISSILAPLWAIITVMLYKKLKEA